MTTGIMADDQLIRQHLLDAPLRKIQERTTCPICGPERKKTRDRSLSVKMDGDAAVYLCHHCGVSGVVELYEDVSSSRTSPVVVDKSNGVTPSGVEKKLTPDQLTWFGTRGIGVDVVQRCGLVNGRVFIRNRKETVSCIGFEYKNVDGSSATKWRDGTKNFSQTGAARSLWRLDEWKSGDLIICEGELDALSFEQLGVFATSVPNGAPSTLSNNSDSSTKYNYLWDAKDQIGKAKRIILALDADEPGRLLAEEIARRIGKARCWRLIYPSDCKDANEILLKYGEDRLGEVLNGATPWPVRGLRDVSEYRSEVLSLHARGLDHGLKVGIPELDEVYRVCPQTLTICTGVPGAGKSSFLTWMSIQLAQNQDWSCAILSAETPPSIHLLQMASVYHGKPYSGRNKMSDTELSDALDWLRSRFVILDDSDTSITSVLERAQAAVLRMGVRLLVIDPYNFLTGSLDSSYEENSVGNINKLLVSLKSFAQEHGIAIWLVAHPVKMWRQKDGTVPIPTGYDISGAAAFYNVADAGITVSRDGENALITVWKVRFPWIGSTGAVELVFDVDTCTFSSVIGQRGAVNNEEWLDVGDF